MTAVETGSILALIYAIFPRAYERQGVEATRDAWQVMFEDDEYEVVKKAVKKVLQTSKFAPTVAEVSAEIAQYKEALRSRLNQYYYHFGAMSEECRACTVKDRLDIVSKCGARKCPREISEEEKQRWYLTTQQIRQIKAILKLETEQC